MPLLAGHGGPFRHIRLLFLHLTGKVGLGIITHRQRRRIQFSADRWACVQRRAESVKGPPKQSRPGRKNRRQAGVADAAARADAAHIAVRHEQQIAVTKTYHLGGDAFIAAIGQHVAHGPQRSAQTAAFCHKAHDLVDLAVQTHGIACLQ